MGVIRLVSVFGFLSFIISPMYADMGLSLEGRYDIATIKKDTNMNTGQFKMTGIEELLLFQFMPGSGAVKPYIGIGAGMIPSYKGAKTPNLSISNVDTQITLKDVTYATIELGPEFVILPVRWQIFAAYDYGLSGKLAHTDTPNSYTGIYKDTKLTSFNRMRVGTRIYFVVTSYFDIGLAGDYAMGTLKDNGKDGIYNSATKYNFTEVSAGLALRLRFGGGGGGTASAWLWGSPHS